MRKAIAILIACLIISGASIAIYAAYRVVTSEITPELKLCGALKGGQILITVLDAKKVKFSDLHFELRMNGKRINPRVLGPLGELSPGDQIKVFLPPMYPGERVELNVTCKELGLVFSKEFSAPSPPKVSFLVMYSSPGSLVIKVVNVTRPIKATEVGYSIYVNGSLRASGVFEEAGNLTPGEEFLLPVNATYGQEIAVELLYKPENVIMYAKEFPMPPGTLKATLDYSCSFGIFTFYLNVTSVEGPLSWKDLGFTLYVNGRPLYPNQYIVDLNGNPKIEGKVKPGDSLSFTLKEKEVSYGDIFAVKVYYKPSGFPLLYERTAVLKKVLPLTGTFNASLSFTHVGSMFTFYLNVTSIKGTLKWQQLYFSVYLNGHYLYPNQYIVELNGKPEILGEVKVGDILTFTLNASFGDTFAVKVYYRPSGTLIYSGVLKLPPYLKIELQRGCLNHGYFNFTVLEIRGEANWSQYAFICYVNGIKVPVKVTVNGHSLYGRIQRGDFVSIKLPGIPSHGLRIELEMVYVPTHTVYFVMIWGGSK